VRASGQARIDAQNPWPGLEAFDEAAERFFNGRTEETAELKRLVMQAPLTALFGMSGLGKTSLLQAGLFPAIRKDNVLPVYVRLDVRSREGPLIDQVARAFQLEMGRHQVDAPPFAEGESLWNYLHRAGLELWSAQNQLLTPLFVLDQFEEVFTLGVDRQPAVAQLRRDLSDLVENRVPAPLAELIRGTDAAGARYFLDGQRYKVLLSFREDFLPPVEGWKREMPSILRNRLRLLPMSAARAFEAVHGTAPDLVNEGLAHRIVEFVAAAQDRGAAGASLVGPAELNVEPALLSLVCHGLNEKRKERGQVAFDEALLRETGPSIISDFYARSVSDLSEAAQRFIEEQLITESGFRKQCAVDDARSRHGVADAELGLLVDRRLLRIEPSRGTEHVELMHDLLTGVVREAREGARQRARHVAQRRRRTRRLAIAGVGIALLTGGFVIRDQRAHDRMERDQRARADSIRRHAREQAASEYIDSLARRIAVEESLQAVVLLGAARAQLALQELDTILNLWTEATVARARLEDRLQGRADRERRLAAEPESLQSGRKARALLDSLREDVVRVADLRRDDSAAGRMVMRGAARAAMYRASASPLPFESYSGTDLFDTRQHARLLRSDSVQFAPALLGASFPENPEPEQQPAFFRDGRQPGSRHWIEWDAPVTALGSVALFAAHDGRTLAVPSGTAPRSLRRVTLTTLGRDDAVLDTLVDYFPAVPYAGLEAYGDHQPLRSLSVCLRTRPTPRRNAAPASGRTRFRLEVVQAGSLGPRIIEVDGYADAGCGAAGRAVLAGLGGSVSAAELARRYGSSTVTIARVLELAELKTTERGQLAGIVEFLARAPEAAWNGALVVRAGEFLLTRRPSGRGSSGAGWSDSLTRALGRMVPDWRSRVARVVGRRRLFDGALSDAQVRDSLAAIEALAGADSGDTLRSWRDELQRLDSLRIQTERVADDPGELLGDRRLALASYIDARTRSIRQGQGTDGPAAMRQRDALADRLRGSWAVCSRSLEGRCRSGNRQASFAAGDSLHATFTPGPGSVDSGVTLVVRLGDSVQLRQSMRVPTASTVGGTLRRVAPAADWGGMVLREPGRWTLRVYDSLDRLVLRHRFTVGVFDSIAIGQRVSGVVSEQSSVFNNRPVEFYQLRCTAGQTMRVDVTSQHDNIAVIVGPRGEEVAFNDDAIGRNAQLDWTCPDNGVYRIGAGGYTMATTGPFVLSVQPAERPAPEPERPARPTPPVSSVAVGTIALGQQVSGTLSSQSTIFGERPVAFYRFRCTAGQAIRVNVTSEYDNIAVIVGAGNAQLAFNDDANSSLNAQLDWTCPDNGLYFIGAGGYTMVHMGPFILGVQPIARPIRQPNNKDAGTASPRV